MRLKKTLSVFLLICMLVTMIPTSVFAAAPKIGEDGKITVQNSSAKALGSIRLAKSMSNPTGAGESIWSDTTLVVSGTIDIRGGITSDGVHCAGIYVAPGKTLTIEGDENSVLNVYGYGFAAAIGGNYNDGYDTATGVKPTNANCGNIIINTKGIVNAIGSDMGGTGIGAGSRGTMGTVTINSGYVNATGMLHNPGIGNGSLALDATTSQTNVGKLIINGGTVVATGGNGSNPAAAIGGGYGAPGVGVEINGGSVMVNAAGVTNPIGGGADNNYAVTPVNGNNEPLAPRTIANEGKVVSFTDYLGAAPKNNILWSGHTGDIYLCSGGFNCCYDIHECKRRYRSVPHRFAFR